jgi:hypothetical protein
MRSGSSSGPGKSGRSGCAELAPRGCAVGLRLSAGPYRPWFYFLTPVRIVGGCRRASGVL